MKKHLILFFVFFFVGEVSATVQQLTNLLKVLQQLKVSASTVTPMAKPIVTSPTQVTPIAQPIVTPPAVVATTVTPITPPPIISTVTAVSPSAALKPIGVFLPTVQDVIAGQRGLVVYSGTANSLPLQPFSTTRMADPTALISSGTSISTIGVSFDVGYPISGTFNLAQIPALTSATLQNGLYVQVDLVAAQNVSNFALTNLIPNSYFYNSGSGNPTLFVSLVDSNNNVYAAAAVSTDFANNPSSYTVTLNNGDQQTASLTGPTPYSAIFVQQASPQDLASTPVAPASTSGIVPLILSQSNISAPSYANAPCSLTGAFNGNNLPSAYNLLSTTSFSCQGGLQSMSIGLTNAANSCFLGFNFDQTILSNPQIINLMNHGMYINVLLQSAPANSGGLNSVIVQLLDENQTLWASGTYQSSTIGGLDHWSLGLNTSDSNVVNGTTQLGYNNIQLNQTVIYKQSSTVSQPVGANVAVQNGQIPNFRM